MTSRGRMIAVGLLLATLPWIGGVARADEQGRAALHRETLATLEHLWEHLDEAGQRWRSDFVGVMRTRSGEVVDEAEVMRNVRQVSESLSRIGEQIESAPKQLEDGRISERRFDVLMDQAVANAIREVWSIDRETARRSTQLLQRRMRTAMDSLREAATGEWAAAAAKVERMFAAQARQDFDRITRRLALARQDLMAVSDQWVLRAKEANRQGTAERFSELIAAEFESGDDNDFGLPSELDTFLEGQRLVIPSAGPGQPTVLAMADLFAGLRDRKLTSDTPANVLAEVEDPEPRVMGAVMIASPSDDAFPMADDDILAGRQGWVLFVFGRHLIDDDAARPTLSEDDERAKYMVLDWTGSPFERDSTSVATPLWQAGWEKVTEGLTSLIARQVRNMDAVIVAAMVDSDELPGPRTFTLNGREVSWRMRPGTLTGELRFVRHLTDRQRFTAPQLDNPEYEPVDHLLIYDDVALELRTETDPGENTIEVLLVRNGEAMSVEGDRTLTLTRTRPGANVFRSQPVFIDYEGKAFAGNRHAGATLALKPGDQIAAMVEKRWFHPHPVTEAAVAMTPARIETHDGRGLLWKDALRQAAEFAGVTVDNWDTIGDQHAEQLTETIVFNWQRHKVEVTIGDHAAMLLLQRRFIDMTEARIAAMERIRDDDALLWGHYLQLKPMMHAAADRQKPSEFPMAFDEVEMPDRGALGDGKRTGPWYVLFVDELLAPRLAEGFEHWSTEEDDDWLAVKRRYVLHAMRQGVEQQIDRLYRALRYAKGVDADEIEELLDLTGRGFGSVVARTRPLLMRLQEQTHDVDGRQVKVLRWTPDVAARRDMTLLFQKFGEVDLARKASDADTEVIMALTMGAALGPESSLLLKLTLLAGDALQLVGDMSEMAEVSANARFARDAFDILGRQRLVQAEKDSKPLWKAAFGAASLAVGAYFDFADASVRVFSDEDVAAGLLRQIERDGAAGLRDLNERELHTIAHYLRRAERAAERGKELSPTLQLAQRAQRAISNPLLNRSLTEPFQMPRFSSSLIDSRLYDTALHEMDMARVLRAGDRMGPVPDGMPLPNTVVSFTIRGREESFQLGDALGVGEYATVYRLLDDSGQPTGRVIKFVRNNPMHDSSSAAEVVQRMQRSYETLSEGGEILSLPCRRFEAEAKIPFVIQDDLANMKNVEYFADPSLAKPGLAKNTWGPEFERAVLQLYRDIADRGLIWMDGHANNIFFQQVDGVWRAGVLDPDMILRAGEPTLNRHLSLRLAVIETHGPRQLINSLAEDPDRAQWHLMDIVRPSMIPTDLRSTWSARQFMLKMLEHKQWIRFATYDDMARRLETGDVGEFIRTRMDPAIVREYFPELEEAVSRPDLLPPPGPPRVNTNN